MSTERNKLYQTLKESWNAMRAPKKASVHPLKEESAYDDTGRGPTPEEIAQAVRGTVKDVDPAALKVATELIDKMFSGQVTMNDVNKITGPKIENPANPKIGQYIKLGLRGWDPEFFNRVNEFVGEQDEEIQAAAEAAAKDAVKKLPPEQAAEALSRLTDFHLEKAMWKAFLLGSLETATTGEAGEMATQAARSTDEKVSDITGVAKDQRSRQKEEEAVRARYQAGEIDDDEAVRQILAIHGNEDKFEKILPGKGKTTYDNEGNVKKDTEYDRIARFLDRKGSGGYERISGTELADVMNKRGELEVKEETTLDLGRGFELKLMAQKPSRYRPSGSVVSRSGVLGAEILKNGKPVGGGDLMFDDLTQIQAVLNGEEQFIQKPLNKGIGIYVTNKSGQPEIGLRRGTQQLSRNPVDPAQAAELEDMIDSMGADISAKDTAAAQEVGDTSVDALSGDLEPEDQEDLYSKAEELPVGRPDAPEVVDQEPDEGFDDEEDEMAAALADEPEEEPSKIAESKKYSGFKMSNIDKKHRLLKEAWSRMKE